MLYDAVLEHVGDFGTYQAVMFILLGLVNFPTAWQNMAMTLFAARMDHWCVIPHLENFTHDQQRYIAVPYDGDDQDAYSQCTLYDLPYENYTLEDLLAWNRSEMAPPGTPEVTCQNGWVFDQSEFESSLVSQFDLVCDNAGQVPLIQTIYMCGFLVGCLVFGQLADRIGRHKSLVIANVMQVVCPLAAAFMPVYPAYVVMRFFCGAASAGGITILFVIISEIVGRSARMKAVILSKIFYAVAYVILPAMSYSIRNHITLQIAVAICPVALWISLFIIPESPRWLILEGRDEEAAKILHKMAAINGATLPEKLNLEDNRTRNEIEILGRNPNVGDLFRTPGLRLVTLNSWFNWFATSLVYYGLSLGVDMLPGSIFVNTCIAGAIEVPAVVICAFAVDYAGRKWTNFATLMGAGISCFLCMIFIEDPEREIAAISLLMIGKFFSAGTFAVIYLYATELFPTLVRTVGLGSSSMIGRVGALIQPQVSRLEVLWAPGPFLVFGTVSFISGILALFLPETLGRKLPDTLEEGETFAKNITFRVKPKKKREDHHTGGSDNQAFNHFDDLSLGKDEIEKEKVISEFSSAHSDPYSKSKDGFYGNSNVVTDDVAMKPNSFMDSNIADWSRL